MKKLLFLNFITFSFVLTISSTVHAQEWKKIDDPEVFRYIYTNSILRAKPWPTAKLDFHNLDTSWQIEYCADGSGVLTFWANETPRTWELIENDKVCISTPHGEKCYFCEENLKYKNIYRCGLVGQKEAPWIFEVTKVKPDICP